MIIDKEELSLSLSGMPSRGIDDRAKVVYSDAFRRLQSKTQIIATGYSDFYRTRLTHSIEVSQIGMTINEHLKQQFQDQSHLLPENALIDAICLSHDIGHPPFGHSGEDALNKLMQDHGGFESNAQNLRIMSKLGKTGITNGMDLSRRCYLGVLKYPNLYSKLKNPLINDHPPKCIYDSESSILEWVLEPFSNTDKDNFLTINPSKNSHNQTLFKSLDCSIMELADDIAYAVHDLEDAIKYKLIDNRELNDLFSRIENFNISNINNILNKFSINSYDSRNLKNFSRQIIEVFINNIYLSINDAFAHPILKYNACMNDLHFAVLESIKEAVKNAVIYTDRVQHLTNQGVRAIRKVFNIFVANEYTLPKNLRIKLKQTEDKHRLICDHVAGMSDNYLKEVYNRMFTFEGEFFMHL